jgi:UDP-GlcNAc:undecaprenyl-phosphate GlcNAc-1-phosphate transferase
VLVLPIANTLLAMWRQGVRGAPIFQADRGHIHHRLLDAGPVAARRLPRTVGRSLLGGLVGLGLTFASGRDAALILVALGLASALALRRLSFTQIERTSEVLEVRCRNLLRRVVLHELTGHSTPPR